jgi:hypothetical protein
MHPTLSEPESEKPRVRKIDHGPVEPIDLIDLAGPSLIRGVAVPVAVTAAVALAAVAVVVWRRSH